MADYKVQVLISAKDAASAVLKAMEGPVGSLESRLRIAGEAAAGFGEKYAASIQAASRVGQGMVAGGAGLAAGFVLAGKAATEFNRGLGEVSTLVDTTQVSMAGLKGAINGIAADTGQSAAALTKSLYQALSAGVAAGDAPKFMGVAARAAVAGVTDAETAVNGLTTAINAWGLKSSDASMVADAMFNTVKAGKTTFGELSASLFNVGPAASAAGVSLQETMAAMSTLTAAGVPTSVAATNIRAALVGLVRPSKEMDTIFQQLGFRNAEAAIKANGFKFALDAVMKASGGSSGTLTTLLGSVEAVQAAQVLAGTGSAKFAADIEAQGKAAGDADKAFQKMAAGAGASFARAREAAQAAFRSIGDAVLPMATKVVNAITPIIKAIGKMAESPLGKVFLVAAAAGSILVMGLGALLIAVGKVAMSVVYLKQAWDGVALSAGKAALAQKAATAAGAGAGAGGGTFGMATAAQQASRSGTLVPMGGAKTAAASAAGGWAAQWAATKVELAAFGAALKGLPATILTFFKGIGSGIRTAFSAAGVGIRGAVAFITSPLGAVGVALAGLGIELHFLKKSYGAMRKAQEDARKALEDYTEMQANAAAEGYITPKAVAMQMGFSEKQYEQGLTGPQSKRVMDEVARQRAEARSARRQAKEEAASAKAAMEAGGAGELIPSEAIDTAYREKKMEARAQEGSKGAAEYLIWLRNKEQKELKRLYDVAQSDNTPEAKKTFADARQASAERIAAAQFSLIDAIKREKAAGAKATVEAGGATEATADERGGAVGLPRNSALLPGKGGIPQLKTEGFVIGGAAGSIGPVVGGAAWGGTSKGNFRFGGGGPLPIGGTGAWSQGGAGGEGSLEPIRIDIGLVEGLVAEHAVQAIQSRAGRQVVVNIVRSAGSKATPASAY